MKKLYLLIIITILLLTSCGEQNEISASDGPSDASDASIYTKPLPTLLISNWIGNPMPQRGDDISDIAEIETPLRDVSFFDESLSGSSIYGTYFGYEIDNAIYMNSKTLIPGDTIIDYYHEDGGDIIGISRKTSLPFEILPVNKNRRRRKEPLTVDELFLLSEQLIQEKTNHDINWNDYVLKDIDWHGDTYAFTFVQCNENGIELNYCYISINRWHCGVTIFRDSRNEEIPKLPDFSAEDYLESAKRRIIDYYNSSNFDLVSEVKDFKIDNVSYVNFDGSKNAIQIIVEYNVVYTDGVVSNRFDRFFYFYD